MAPKRKKKQSPISNGNTLAKAFKRQEAATAAEPLLPLEADWSPPTAPDELMQQAATLYEEYRDAAPDRAVAIAPTGAMATRRRAAALAAEEEDADDIMDPGATQADEAASAADLSSRWEQKAAQCVEKLGHWAGEAWTLPLSKQEALVHIVMNHDRHQDLNIALGAYRVLQQNLGNFPAAKVLPASNGMPERAVINRLAWNPLCTTGSCPSALAGGITLLARLAANNLAVARGSSSASQGQALLLQHVLRLLQQDLAARLQVHAAAAAAAAGAAAGGAGVGGEAWVRRERLLVVLRGSMLFRLMQGDLSWSMQPRSKGQMVKDLVLAIVAGLGQAGDAAAGVSSKAGGSGSVPSSAGSGAGGQQDHGQQLQQGGPVTGAVSAQAAGMAGKQLLGMLLQLYGRCEEAGMYCEARANMGVRDQRCNDRFELDSLLRELLASASMPTELKDPAAVQLLLRQLPPVDALRLLAMVVAEAVARRPYDEKAAKSNHLAEWHEYYVDKGVGWDSFRTGDALELMRAINDRYSWASGTLLGGKQHFIVLVDSLVSAALATEQSDTGDDAAALREAVGQLLGRMKGEVHGQLGKRDTNAAVLLGLAAMALRLG